MSNIVFVAKGRHDTGKTTAVKQIMDCLLEKGAQLASKQVIASDIIAILIYNGIKVGISSAGDPGIDQKKILNNFISNGCSIIVCACRTRGATKDSIEEVCANFEICYYTPTKDGFIAFSEMWNDLWNSITNTDMVRR